MSAGRLIVGQAPEITKLYEMIERVAPSEATVLVIGESGTGKELVARELHRHSKRSGGPFVAINCGAIPENLIESELFGHKRGSFTGAVSDKPGLFETAKGGTLFLDEIGELPLQMQVKLLRALQEKAVRRVGANETIKIDARIVAATNKNLDELVARGAFREDLYYRLNVIILKPLPLRERGGDIEELAAHFLKRYAAKAGRAPSGFTDEAFAAIRSYAWPGNVRELENAIERAATLESGDRIGMDVLPLAIQRGNPAAGEVSAVDFSSGPVDLAAIVKELESVYVKAALAHTKGDESRAAGLLKMELKAFRQRLKS